MLLNCGVGEDSWESLGLQGDSSSPSQRRSALNFHWKDWCWSWNSNTLATWCEELTHGKGPDAAKDWRQEERGWQRMRWLDGITDSMDIWASFGSWWWTGKPGMLQSMGSWRVGHDWVTELKMDIKQVLIESDCFNDNQLLILFCGSLKQKYNQYETQTKVVW